MDFSGLSRTKRTSRRHRICIHCHRSGHHVSTCWNLRRPSGTASVVPVSYRVQLKHHTATPVPPGHHVSTKPVVAESRRTVTSKPAGPCTLEPIIDSTLPQRAAAPDDSGPAGEHTAVSPVTATSRLALPGALDGDAPAPLSSETTTLLLEERLHLFTSIRSLQLRLKRTFRDRAWTDPLDLLPTPREEVLRRQLTRLIELYYRHHDCHPDNETPFWSALLEPDQHDQSPQPLADGPDPDSTKTTPCSAPQNMFF